MITIANPIYDSVFKFMMQDPRVAKIFLQNLLNCTIEELVVKNNEIITIEIDNLKLSKLDYSARIVQDNGEKTLVTIELQRAFEKTEVMRFRKYIGEQYISSENCFKNTIVVNNQKKVIDEPIPIIAIYLLGHNL
ncbi:MAG: hypothetical protein MJ211_14115, partial [Bacteroidales bacterium]|nr:hypothetical protein [Bacteroidales bacterium]